MIAWCGGDQAALDRLMPFVYEELHGIAHRYMRGERADHALQTTALVHEAYIRLIDVTRVQWQNRAHFFAVSAQLMRRILVDAARQRNTRKRGADPSHVALDQDLLEAPERGIDVVAIDDALTKLKTLDPRAERVVELRYFGGLDVAETAEALHVSVETVTRDWRFARLWLLRELRAPGERAEGRPRGS